MMASMFMPHSPPRPADGVKPSARCNASVRYRHRLLRPRRERPHRRAAEQQYELAPFHSITSSARPSSVGVELDWGLDGKLARLCAP